MAGEPRQLVVDVVRCALPLKTSLIKLTQGNRISSSVIELAHPTICKTPEKTEDSVFKICVDLQSVLAGGMEPRKAEERDIDGLGMALDSKKVRNLRLSQTSRWQPRAQVSKKSKSLRQGQSEVPRLVKNASFPPITKPSNKFPSYSHNAGISASHISLPLINVLEQGVLTSSSIPIKTSQTVTPFPRILLKKRKSLVDGTKTSECKVPPCKLPDVSAHSTEQLLERLKARKRDKKKGKEREMESEIGVPEYPDHLFLSATLQLLREGLIHLPGLNTEEMQRCSGAQPARCPRMKTVKTERELQGSFQPSNGIKKPVTLSMYKRNLTLVRQIQSNNNT
ncbi:uncharacterized protein LOC118224518 isoform X1 [Anguilla anguilla]|uniref:uncharacterized protein LOC118224518 isoform X1 n=1 Tax=Anguilla anguilla TaxID=7936 RepID=UPI0015B2E122|nr:uncharacterized protein LOC118224518 isoform X1 [Anguilla anguilla]